MKNKKENKDSLIEYFSGCKTLLDLQERIQDLIGYTYYSYLQPTKIYFVQDTEYMLKLNHNFNNEVVEKYYDFCDVVLRAKDVSHIKLGDEDASYIKLRAGDASYIRLSVIGFDQLNNNMISYNNAIQDSWLIEDQISGLMKDFEENNLAYRHLSDTLSSLESEYGDKILALRKELTNKITPIHQNLAESYNNCEESLKDTLGYNEAFEDHLKYEVECNKYGVVKGLSGFEYNIS